MGDAMSAAETWWSADRSVLHVRVGDRVRTLARRDLIEAVDPEALIHGVLVESAEVVQARDAMSERAHRRDVA